MSGAAQLHLLGPTPSAEEDQWFTPDWLAEAVVRFADLPEGSRVVELGAGDGAFVRPLLAAGLDVVAVERDPRFAAVLRARFPSAHVNEMDALAPEVMLLDPFDAYVGNPPYSKPRDADLDFVMRGLDLAPRVVAVLRLVFLAGQDRHRRLWAKHHLHALRILPGRPAFIGEVDDGAKADFAVFDIRRGPAPEGHRADVGWLLR